LMAICRASVSPSRGTSTGAFILRQNRPTSHHRHNLRYITPAHLICKALVPNIRARSYFVKYGVVILTLFGCLSPCSPAPTPPDSACPPLPPPSSPFAISASWSIPLIPFTSAPASSAPSSPCSPDGSPSGSWFRRS
jgi:hypothetical protein